MATEKPKLIVHGGVAGLNLNHLTPIVGSSLVSIENIDGSGAGGYVVFQVSAYHNPVPVEPQGMTELISRFAVEGEELPHLTPVVHSALVTIENVCGTGCRVTARSSRGGHISFDHNGCSQGISGGIVVRHHLSNLTPAVRSTLITGKHIHGTGAFASVVVAGASRNHAVNADRHGGAEVVSAGSVGSGDFGYLTPGVLTILVTFEDIGRARIRLVAGSAHHDRIPAEGNGSPELIAGCSVGSGDLGNLSPSIASARISFEYISGAHAVVIGSTHHDGRCPPAATEEPKPSPPSPSEAVILVT